MQLYIGQGDYRMGEKGPWRDPGQLDRQLDLNEKYAVQGSVHFSAKQIRADRLGAVTRYRQTALRHAGAAAHDGAVAGRPASAPRLVGARQAGRPSSSTGSSARRSR